MNTFSDVVMRTHPSNKPASCVQVQDSNETAQFFAYFANIHVRLQPYKRQLILEASS